MKIIIPSIVFTTLLLLAISCNTSTTENSPKSQDETSHNSASDKSEKVISETPQPEKKIVYKDSRILEKNEVNAIFTSEVKSKLGIEYPIYRVYEYADNTGEILIVLSEKPINDKIVSKIKLFAFEKRNNDFIQKWELNDGINNVEKNMNFWTKYCVFKDLDGDGTVEPIIVFGSTGENGFDDGRVKILVYFNNQKYVIRHQNGVTDYDRVTQIDQSFYNLPTSIQSEVKSIMQNIIDNNQTIFPNGWNEKMNKKQTKITE